MAATESSSMASCMAGWGGCLSPLTGRPVVVAVMLLSAAPDQEIPAYRPNPDSDQLWIARFPATMSSLSATHLCSLVEIEVFRQSALHQEGPAHEAVRPQ